MTQNINLIPNEPGLQDLLNYYKKLTKLEINCHHVGTITSFNALTQTAQATINYTKTFLQVDTVGDTSISPTNYAQLIDCPVVVLGGGGGALTFPIEEGDECLVLFNDRDFDNWYNGSSNAAPSTPRSHAFSDAIVLVGIRSLANVLLQYDTDAVALRFETCSVKIYDNKVLVSTGPLLTPTTLEIDATGKIKITNTTGELISSLVTLFTDIQNGLVTTMLGPEPLVMPTYAADLLVLESFKA